MDNFEFEEHLRKNYITIDSLDLGGFKIGGLDYKNNYSDLLHDYCEAHSYMLKRHCIYTSSRDVCREYDFLKLDIDNVRLIFWMCMLHYKILKVLGEEIVNFYRRTFWYGYREDMWGKPTGDYDYCNNTIIPRMKDQNTRFDYFSKKAKHILTFLGNEAIDNL